MKSGVRCIIVTIIFLSLLVFLQPFAFYNWGSRAAYVIAVLILCSAFCLFIEMKKGAISEKNKIDFVSLAVHQLKAPLSTMKMSLDMFAKGEFGEVSEKQKDVLGKVYKKNETMISLVDDLLNVSKLEEGKDYVKAPAHLEEIIQSVANAYKEEMQRKGISFEFEKGGEKLPEISIDDKKMKLVFQNLFDNAIKYTPAGGKITVLLSKKDGSVEFKIQDSGIGIPESQKGEIFSKFFRGRNAARTGTDGSGLGLFIAKSVVDAHKGKIWFESQENKGAAFFITLPID